MTDENAMTDEKAMTDEQPILPEERIEDLAPEEESEQVSGGASGFYDWLKV
jgi:hypothetical protein